jgi:carbon storage regulator
MLVITRKIEESIILGNEIVVTVLEIENNRVKIGIEAPKQISIYRDEIYHKINNKKLNINKNF